jgi:hypothetical protein
VYRNPYKCIRKSVKNASGAPCLHQFQYKIIFKSVQQWLWNYSTLPKQVAILAGARRSPRALLAMQRAEVVHAVIAVGATRRQLFRASVAAWLLGGWTVARMLVGGCMFVVGWLRVCWVGGVANNI